MHYFVTGATGFIGKRLVKNCCSKKAGLCISCCALTDRLPKA
jgi:nucleoside-diphosphate-sugar epimerase